MKQKGFTLIELMITLVVMGILLSAVVGTAQTVIANARLRAITDEFRTGLMTAKMEAIKRNSAITFNPDANGWDNGWNIKIPANFIPTGMTADPDGNLELHSKAVPTAVLTVTTDVTTTAVRFTGTGRPDAPVKFSFKPTDKTCPKDDPHSEFTCLNVEVTSGGQIKVCNPNAEKKSGYGC